VAPSALNGKLALGAPITPYEEYVGRAPSIVLLDGSTVPPHVTAVGVTLMQFPRNPLQVKTNSTILTLQTTLYTNAASGNGLASGRRLDAVLATTPLSLSVTLQNYAPFTYNFLPSTTTVLQCYRKRGGAYSVEASCPDGSRYSVLCPGTKGSFTVTCPSHKDQPRCDMWDADSQAFSPEPHCKVVSYTTKATTCQCSFTSSAFASASASATSASEAESAARFWRRLGSSTVLEQVFSVSMEVLTTPLVQVYAPAPAIIEQHLDEVIGATTWSLVGVCAVLGLFMLNTDTREIMAARKTKMSDAKAVRTVHNFFAKLVPREFSPGEWQEIFLHRLKVEHSWLGLFSRFSTEGDYRSVKLATALSGVLSILFMTTLLASTFFSDDGSCEFISDAATCASTHTPLNVRFSCQWFEYNSSCGFSPPIVDGLGVLLYAAVALLVAAPMTKVLETLAREALVRKVQALEKFQDTFPWQTWARNRAEKAAKLAAVVPTDTDGDGNEDRDGGMMNSPDKTFEKIKADLDDAASSMALSAQLGGSPAPSPLALSVSLPSSPAKSSPGKMSRFGSPFRSPHGGGGGASSLRLSLGGGAPSERSAVSSPGFGFGRPSLEYWERCDELADSQTLTAKMLHAARLRKLQEYTDFVLPMLEVEMLIQLNQTEKRMFGRQLLITDSREKQQLSRSETVKRSRYTFFEPSKQNIMSRLMAVRAEAEVIKNELELIQHSPEEQEEYLVKKFVLDNLQGYRNRIATRFVLGEGRFESSDASHALWRVVRRRVSLVLLVVLWALMLFYVTQTRMTIGSRATTLWLLVTIAALLQDIFALQPARIWLRWVAIHSFVAKDVRDIFKALQTRFVSIVQRKAGAMRDANALVQHFNPACRVARQFPHLPVSRFLIAVNDYDVPHFSVEGMPLKLRRGRDWWFGLLGAGFTTFLHYATLAAPPVQDALYDWLATLSFECVLLLIFVAGQASPVLGALLALCFPAALAAREWWKRVLRRRRARARAFKMEEDEILYGNLSAQDLGKSPLKRLAGSGAESPSSGGEASPSSVRARSPPGGKAGKPPPPPGRPPAWSPGGFLSALSPMGMGDTGGSGAAGGKNDAYLVDDSLDSGIDDTARFNSKFKPAKGEITKKWVAYRAPLPAIRAVSPSGGDGDGGNGPSGLGLDELPTTLPHGGGGAFGSVREKPRGRALPPLEAPPDLAQTIASLERSITQNLESVIRETLLQQSGRGRRKANRERRDRREGGGGGGGEDEEYFGGASSSSPTRHGGSGRKRRGKRGGGGGKSDRGDESASAGPGTARGERDRDGEGSRPGSAALFFDAEADVDAAFPSLPDLPPSPDAAVLVGPGSSPVKRRLDPASSSGAGRREDPGDIIARAEREKQNLKALESSGLEVEKSPMRKRERVPTDAIFPAWHDPNSPDSSPSRLAPPTNPMPFKSFK
jgi:hypothetical protein